MRGRATVASHRWRTSTWLHWHALLGKLNLFWGTLITDWCLGRCAFRKYTYGFECSLFSKWHNVYRHKFLPRITLNLFHYHSVNVFCSFVPNWIFLITVRRFIILSYDCLITSIIRENRVPSQNHCWFNVCNALGSEIAISITDTVPDLCPLSPWGS